MRKRIFSFVLVLMMLMAFVPCVHAATIVSSGTCGDALTWTLDNEGTLTINGTGEMTDNPWGNNIKSVIINDGVTSICNNAFDYCKNLTTIKIPDSVIVIGHNAFAHCQVLSDIRIPNRVERIEDATFYNCSLITHVDIPQNITSIGVSAFENCTSLQSIDIPYNVTNIENYAFANCSALESITLPDNTIDFTPIAFLNTAYTNNLSNWENGALYIGHHLVDVNNDVEGDFYVKSGTITIASDLFLRCKNLHSINIPPSVIHIGNKSFPISSLSQLEEINADSDHFKSIDGVLFNSKLTELIAYPIGKKDTSYYIPSGVEIINEYAIRADVLANVFIPASVKKIESYAFAHVKNVYYGGNADQWYNIDIIYDERSQALDNRILLGLLSDEYNASISFDSLGLNPPTISDVSNVINNYNGTYTVPVTLGSVEYACDIIAVLYNNGIMTGLQNVPLFAGELSAAITVFAENADTAKVFIWDSLEGMKPLCDAKEVTIQ